MKQINNKQKGFSILAVILVIVAVIVTLGIWILSGQSNTSTLSSSTVDIQASDVLNEANNIKLSYDRLILSGKDSTQIIFMPNLSSDYNILDPQNGIQISNLNKSFLRTRLTAPTDGVWVMAHYDNDGGIGTLNSDIAIFVSGIKDTICQRINYNLFGSTTIPKFAGGITKSNNFLSGASVNNPNSFPVNTKFGLNVTNWTAGCFKANTSLPDQNVFLRILQVN